MRNSIDVLWDIQKSFMRNPIEVRGRLGVGWAESPLWWLASWNIEWKFNLLLTFCNLLGDTSLGEGRGILRGRKVYRHTARNAHRTHRTHRTHWTHRKVYRHTAHKNTQNKPICPYMGNFLKVQIQNKQCSNAGENRENSSPHQTMITPQKTDFIKVLY